LHDENAASADWDVNASAWAYAAGLEEVPRKAFWQSHDEWVQFVITRCQLTAQISKSQRECVISTYRVRANALRSKLTGDALAEVKLSPEQRADIQARLVSMGLLADKPDGEFGPNTRAAIRKFQQANGLEGGAFLTAQQREILLASGPTVRAQAQTFPATPSQSQSELYLRVPGSSGQSQALPQGSQSNQPQFPTTPNNSAGISLSRGQSAATKTVEVTASGSTSEEARKEAARMAVQQVAGVYIDDRRRVEINMSNEKVSEIVEEKLLSYTNAYVSTFEVLSADHKSGAFTITARVTVAVAPLLKTLQANNVPTVKFDSSSAAATAETTSEEKEKALQIFKDLIAHLDNLVQIGVGKVVASPSIPSAPGSTWISIPITFFANKNAAQEWQTKFNLIADRHAQLAITIGQSMLGGRSCPIPMMTGPQNTFQTFLGKPPGPGESGVAACFISSATPTGVTADCFGRTFVVPTTTASTVYAERNFLSSIVGVTRQMRLAVEFIDENGSTVYQVEMPFQKFPSIAPPSIAVENSQSQPAGSMPFWNYCSGNNQIIFFKVFTPHDDEQWAVNFGYTIIFPPPGSRINAVLNVLMPNDKISQIDSIRASIRRNE
jgi:peptidoglycan hydrolase-like protein with peptidoglycan-binding domain